MARKKKNVNSPTKDDPHGGFVEVAHDHLADCLATLKTVLVKRAHRKDLASVHIEVKPDHTATIAATDTENAIQLKLTVLRATGSGRVMIDTHALEMTMGAYKEPRARIHLDDPTNVRVEGLSTKLKLPGYDPGKEWKLTAPGSLTSSGWIVRADALASAIRRTKFAVDLDNGTRYAMGGLALFFPAHEGDPMEVVGCDGRRLSVVRVPVRPHGTDPARTWRPVKKGDPGSTGVAVVPNKGVAALLKIALAAGDSSVGLCVLPGDPTDLEKKTHKPGRVQAVTRAAVLTTQCPEARFPEWQEALPAGDMVAEFTLRDARPFAALLGTAAAACDSEHKGIDVVLAGGCVMIESGSDTKGKSRVSMVDIAMTGKGSFSMDGLMFRQFFDAIGSSPVRVCYFGEKSPVSAHAGPDHDFIQMPLTRDFPTKPADNPLATPAPAPEAAVAVAADEPEGDEPDDGGGSAPVVPDDPEPPVPVATHADAPKRNGRAKTGAK